MEKLKIKRKIKVLNLKNLRKYKLNNNNINIIDINYNQRQPFEKISTKSNHYIENSFKTALSILKNKISNKLVNGPISKKHFLKKNFLGVTEYLAKKTKIKSFAMLIYNKKLSVCPITTHLPIKLVPKNLNIKTIKNKIILINNFYKDFFKRKPRIAVTGLNPHCESVLKKNEILQYKASDFSS